MSGPSAEDFAAYGKERPKASDRPLTDEERGLFRDLDALYSETSEEAEWACEGIVVFGGTTDLPAKPKTGKSQFALGLSRAGLRHEEFLSRAVSIDRVIYCSEQADVSFKDQVSRAGLHKDTEGFHLLSLSKVRRLDWPSRAALIERYVQDDPTKRTLVVIDTLSKWAGLKADEENSAGHLSKAAEPLQRLVAETGIALLVLRHAGKKDASDDLSDAGRGSNAFAGEADILLSLRRVGHRLANGRTTRELRGSGRFVEVPEELLIEWQEDGRYVVIGETEAVQHEVTVKAVLDLLADGREETEDGIAKALDQPRTSVRRALMELTGLRDGRVTRLGDGHRNDPYRYRLTVSDQTPPGHAGAQAHAHAYTPPLWSQTSEHEQPRTRTTFGHDGAATDGDQSRGPSEPREVFGHKRSSQPYAHGEAASTFGPPSPIAADDHYDPESAKDDDAEDSSLWAHESVRP
jgi:hypothetical protein